MFGNHITLQSFFTLVIKFQIFISAIIPSWEVFLVFLTLAPTTLTIFHIFSTKKRYTSLFNDLEFYRCRI